MMKLIKINNPSKGGGNERDAYDAHRTRCLRRPPNELGEQPRNRLVTKLPGRLTKLKLDDRGRLFPEGWEKKENHNVISDLIKRSPRQNGEGGRTPKHEYSIEAECRRGEGKNAGRIAGRPKAVNQGGDLSPKNPE
ncbi:hypothetical protein TNCV_1335811 [Trichonephila clavipes]|nr:hypothetical protein TNCV_1335811 [Trichonephila clavipes]